MTPHREEYLAKCSERETLLRMMIQQYKDSILSHKYALNKDETFTEEDRRYRLRMLRYAKYHLAAYRHELARLKGMDRVVVPSDAYTRKYLGTGTCVCEFELDKKHHSYCPNCGRRVLWRR